MKKSINLLTLSGSPVNGASTDILLEEIARSIRQHLPDEITIEETFVKLSEREIKGCVACGESPEPDWCIFHEVDDIYKQLVACDCLLFGSPVYFDSVSAQAKLFIDRCNCFRPPDFFNSQPGYLFKKRLPGKRPGAMVLVGGEKTWYEGARRVVAGFFKWVEVTNAGMVQFGSDDYTASGLVGSDTGKLREAQDVGKKLAEILNNR